MNETYAQVHTPLKTVHWYSQSVGHDESVTNKRSSIMFRNTLSSTLILSSLCACSDYDLQSIPDVNDGEQARIEVSPSFIDFGIARENELIQREVTVKKCG